MQNIMGVEFQKHNLSKTKYFDMYWIYFSYIDIDI